MRAVISLPRDAFADLAKTTAKTSILLLIRKEDLFVVQREPVFFARAERTGPSGNNLTRHNDLVDICNAFDCWREKVLEHCRGLGIAVPTSEGIDASEKAAFLNSCGVGQVAVCKLDHDKLGERLNEAFWCMKGLIDLIPNSVSLRELAHLVPIGGRVPPEQTIYAFASVSRNEARVRSKGRSSTAYSVDDLQMVQEGDILVSGIDLVNGAVGVVGRDCDGMVVSVEYIILRAKEGVDAHWLVTLLRTGAVRRIIEGTITGTSNRTRVESPEVLMSLRLPKAPPTEQQTSIGNHLRNAITNQRGMMEEIRQGLVLAATTAALPFTMAADDGTTIPNEVDQ